ncbi:MAG: type II CRISPR RNA-guided endonuclease Cas9 [Clostridia bacterium]|nr:type II CRISPR RNA-guided endonuclease Cas9 [Clostridia bacterium]
MKTEKYYVGLDIGTDSVGYAVTDEQYNLCKFKGEPMWGVTLFDDAQSAADRRGFRVARRRLDRRQQRIELIRELFALEISKKDENFFKRIKESYLYPENKEQKVRLFHSYEEQKKYMTDYPTIHHLICELMNSKEPHDVRLVYIACAWLVAHRGHFLSEVDKKNVDAVTNFSQIYKKLVDHITRGEYALPWRHDFDIKNMEDALKAKLNITKKSKRLAEALFKNGKAPKNVDEQYEYNYELLIKLLCGSDSVKLKDLFGKSEYEEIEEKLSMESEKLPEMMELIDEDDAELLRILKEIYDWSVLVDVLKGKKTISDAKVSVYEQHDKDLEFLKYLIKKYIPQKYNGVFRSQTVKNNYVAYIGKNHTANKDIKVKKSNSKEDFCKYILSLVKNLKPDACDAEFYQNMIARLETNDFMPKQVDGDNRVIPYQLYWYELNKILENAKGYIPFLSEMDADGMTGAEKILSVFEFRVPYYVGPLKENPTGNRKFNHWMVRKAQGKIYPWNFNCKVDLDASEEAFIARMTNSCTYLPGEDVLPKNSLLYCAFEVLNEINNIQINGNGISISVKQELYENVFMQRDKVTVKHIKDYLESNNYVKKGEYILSGLDITVKSSLRPFRAFRNLVKKGLLSYADVENIIRRAAYSEDKSRYTEWLHEHYSHLPASEISYISGLKFKEFGRLSKKLLCGIEGALNHDTGEWMTVIRAMWETNYNFMELMSNQFKFADEIQKIVKEYYGTKAKSISEQLDDMYISNAVKRPMIRTLDILKDIVKIQKTDPEMIFIEMARGAKEDQKGKRTDSRLKQILDLYDKIDQEKVRELQKKLEEWGDTAHSKLQIDKIFLYFMQLGRCLYTDAPISLESLLNGDGTYNIEHIYPRSFVKDDSIINNKILVDSKANGEKGDNYPISSDIRNKMKERWIYLHKIGLIRDEKFKRLIRTTHFTDDEKFEFINRQLVETRQSTKAVASLLKEIYPDTEIVYVKAGLVSDFRQKFDLLKSRVVNDLHHAKDAYLNIVVGNVWHYKFSRRYYLKDADNNVKPEIVFTRPVKCGEKVIWNGAVDKDRVVKIARKNTAHLTMYSFCRHSGQNGGFFDQNPVCAKEGLIPLKKDMPTEIYGGYDSATISGFILVKYRSGKKSDIRFVPLRLLDIKKITKDHDFAVKHISNELGKKAEDIEILFNKRIIKIYTMLSLDGARFCIRGKASSSEIGLMNMMPFMSSQEYESYIRKIEALNKKYKKNENMLWDEKFDCVSKEKNEWLYDHYIEKLSKWPYNKRPGNNVLIKKIREHIEDFKSLDIFKQVYVLLQIQGILGRMKQADLKLFHESANSGTAPISLNLSNWKKTYTDVRIIDQSASGLFEEISENLLDLL